MDLDSNGEVRICFAAWWGEKPNCAKCINNKVIGSSLCKLGLLLCGKRAIIIVCIILLTCEK